MQLSQSLEKNDWVLKENEKKKKDEELKEHCELGPGSMQKLTEKGIDVSKLIKKEISVVFLFYFSIDIHSISRNKEALVEKLQAKMLEGTAGKC